MIDEKLNFIYVRSLDCWIASQDIEGQEFMYIITPLILGGYILDMYDEHDNQMIAVKNTNKKRHKIFFNFKKLLNDIENKNIIWYTPKQKKR